MATAALAMSREGEHSAAFSHSELKAPLLMRLAAFAIDYMVLLALPVIWLLVSSLMDEHGSASVGGWVWFFSVVVFAIDLVLLPLFNGQTLGKLITGLRIVNLDGSDVSLMGIVRRNVIGYLVTAMTGGLGFLLAGITTSGRALHDVIGGTAVIRGRRTQI